jgi:hypothetical protein
MPRVDAEVIARYGAVMETRLARRLLDEIAAAEQFGYAQLGGLEVDPLELDQNVEDAVAG